MTLHDVLIQYERRLSEAQAGLAQARLHSISAGVALAIATAFFVVLGVYAIRAQIPVWWPSVPLPVAAVSAGLYRRKRKVGSAMWRIHRYCERAIRRVRGEWMGHGVTGDEFDDSHHAYAHDLGIFGRGSLFELLCMTRSGAGKRGLASYLADPPAVEETLARQQAIGELRPQTGLREKIVVLGPTEFSDSSWETFREWLDSPSIPFPPILRGAIFVSSAVLACILLAGATGALPFMAMVQWAVPLVGFHAALGWMLRGRVTPRIDSLRNLTVETQVIREGLRLLEEQTFESAKLRELSKRARGASRSLRRLERLLNALSERRKDYFYYPSLVLMLGTQLCMATEHWRVRHRNGLMVWLDAWAEFEALNALACYGYENPDNTIPEFSDGEAHLEARALRHPLLPRETCVANDVELNRGARFYVVSGSNMSGKSTLLRAIGLNIVLARAGAPVSADSLRISMLTVCASLLVVDSLANGKSKFMAEIDRLRQAIDISGGASVLFLIDEILGGTNSRDRRIAAEAVVRTLVERGAIGALSTHDLALTEIALCLGGTNVHMGSRDGGGPMDFDYRLKAGVTRETNALAIARMAGVPV